MTADETRACPCNCHTNIRKRVLVCPAGWGRMPEPLRRRIVATQHARYEDRPGDWRTIAANRNAVGDAYRWMRQHPMPHRVLTLAELADVPDGVR